MKTIYTYLVFFIFPIIGICKVGAQSNNENYIQTRTYTEKNAATYVDKIEYFDGLGRPIQTIQKNITPKSADLVTLQEYDSYGRKSNAWLPAIIANNRGAFVKSDAIKKAAKESNVYQDLAPFSKPIYENSPLNRIVTQYAPGQEWHQDYSFEKGKALRTYYLTNKGEESSSTSLVLGAKDSKFVIKGDFLICTNYQIKNEKLIKNSNYKAGELYVTLTSDEDGNHSLEFKDKLEQVILTRQINNSEKYDTYYVYDDFGNLRYVLPPLAVDRLTNYSDDNEVMKQLVYIYKYDQRNRCIHKKLPGAERVDYYYDKADNVILMQDGELRKNKRYYFSVPDVLGRIVITGTCTGLTTYGINCIGTCDISSFNDRIVNALGDFQEAKFGGYEIIFDQASEYDYAYIEDATIHTINYYDTYRFMEDESYESGFKDKQYIENYNYGKKYGNARGMLTGTINYLLDNSNASISSVMYYDDKKNIIQTHSSNHLGGKESEYIAYNFTGQPTKKLHEHIVDNKLISELYTYDYDHAGRLLTTYHELTVDGNRKHRTLLASNSYDELGRLIKTEKGSDASKIVTDYKYNIRSWTTEINSYSGSAQLFNQKLAYNTAPSGVAMGKAQWGGNISGMTWKVKDESGSRGYRFEYDQLSRLTSANYLDNPQTSSNYTAEYTYDKHGNFATISRYGNASGKEVDKLSFTYQGNQLVNIKDGGVNNMNSNTTDFIDYANGTGVYTYNANGAMSKDTHKGISEINYNSLNLPTSLIIKNRNHDGNINYTYSASGQKLQTVHNINPDPSNMAIMGAGSYASAGTKKIVTDYVGNKVYEEKTLNKVLVAGGYFDIKKNKYFYYLADHLGNNRAVADENGDIIQHTHYYPFGMAFPEAKGKDEQAYKYNGKEQDTRLGLNLYDYSARYLDNGIGRLTSIDPLAELYFSLSPYVFVKNNPLRFVDPNGMTPIDSVDWQSFDIEKDQIDLKEIEVTPQGNNDYIYPIPYITQGSYGVNNEMETIGLIGIASRTLETKGGHYVLRASSTGVEGQYYKASQNFKAKAKFTKIPINLTKTGQIVGKASGITSGMLIIYDVNATQQIRASHIVNLSMTVISFSKYGAPIAAAWAICDIGTGLVLGVSLSEEIDKTVGSPLYEW